ncbi:MAG: DMT family transporter [Verrucomicrobiota bacterium]|nr:DMT family transporter [Verrucomicrobiota bacterium]
MAHHSHEPIPPRLLLGIGMTLIAYLFFITVSSIVWKIERIPIAQILFFQNVVALLLVSPLVLRKGIKALKTTCPREHLLRDLFGVGSYFFYFLAIQDWDLTNATLLNYSTPFFIPIFWWIWTKQKVGPNVWWAIIVGFIGVAIVLNPSRPLFELGFVYGLFAGISSALAFCALRILNLRRESMERILSYYFSLGIILSFPFALISWTTPTPLEWLQLLGIGVGTLIAQILLTIAYRFGTASYLSPLGYSTVIYAALISWLLFDILPSVQTFIGSLFIILGGTLTYILKKRPESLAETFKNPDAK